MAGCPEHTRAAAFHMMTPETARSMPMSRFNPNAPSSRDGSVMSRWAGVVVTLVIAGAAMAVSWGAANTRLDAIENQITKMDRSLQKVSEDTSSIRERVARMEGRQP